MEQEVPAMKKVTTPKSRFQHLYKDYEMRKRRLQERFDRKCRQEEEDLRRQLQSASSQRSFDPGAFLDWYEHHLDRYHVAERARLEEKRSAAQRRAMQELAECSFAPLPSKSPPPAARPSSLGAKRASTPSGKHGKEEAGPDGLIVNANQLIAEQALQIEELHRLDRQEQDHLAGVELVAARDLEGAIDESKRKVRYFLETADGREYLMERAKSYMMLNPGISQDAAMREAHDDLVRASEAKLRAQISTTSRQRSQNDLQHIMMERLRVVRELIQLQRSYQSLRNNRDVPHEALKGFDVHLVHRLTGEPWYGKAREAAKRILTTRSASSPFR